MKLTTFFPALLLGLAAGAPSYAQNDFPSKPITLVVPFPPGGPTDLYARALAQGLVFARARDFPVYRVLGPLAHDLAGSAGDGRARRHLEVRI